jgi:riboflavin synthase
LFTGLIEACGRVEHCEKGQDGARFVIAWPGLKDPLSIGESIAVSGCCLTVVATSLCQFTVEAGPETLARTNLRSCQQGDHVNLERALQVGARFGGHFVQGHVDTTAVLVDRKRQQDWAFLRFTIDPDWISLLVPKGSIALDGVSLTLVDVSVDQFSVMLIPHTLAVTTLGSLLPGRSVNVEADILAKHLRNLLEPLLKTFLSQKGLTAPQEPTG